ncbi:hypothetical protein B0H17DRAFT_1330717 [Mycena rosella]|uniref:Uncharacterized protein n=1 Tax=Mycena rosella TaxID=1033263 RepID=A0AAD7DIG8_MYCRO|nr:hypothetical protein B0H17DRAFT_1330717 [Mycena rosella]
MALLRYRPHCASCFSSSHSSPHIARVQYNYYVADTQPSALGRASTSRASRARRVTHPLHQGSSSSSSCCGAPPDAAPRLTVVVNLRCAACACSTAIRAYSVDSARPRCVHAHSITTSRRIPEQNVLAFSAGTWSHQRRALHHRACDASRALFGLSQQLADSLNSWSASTRYPQVSASNSRIAQHRVRVDPQPGDAPSGEGPLDAGRAGSAATPPSSPASSDYTAVVACAGSGLNVSGSCACADIAADGTGGERGRWMYDVRFGASFPLSRALYTYHLPRSPRLFSIALHRTRFALPTRTRGIPLRTRLSDHALATLRALALRLLTRTALTRSYARPILYACDFSATGGRVRSSTACDFGGNETLRATEPCVRRRVDRRPARSRPERPRGACDFSVNATLRALPLRLLTPRSAYALARAGSPTACARLYALSGRPRATSAGTRRSGCPSPASVAACIAALALRRANALVRVEAILRRANSAGRATSVSHFSPHPFAPALSRLCYVTRPSARALMGVRDRRNARVRRSAHAPLHALRARVWLRLGRGGKTGAGTRMHDFGGTDARDGGVRARAGRDAPYDPSSRALFEDMGYDGGGVNGALRWKDLAMEYLLPVDEDLEEEKRAIEARKMASGASNAAAMQAGMGQDQAAEEDEKDESDENENDEDDEGSEETEGEKEDDEEEG